VIAASPDSILPPSTIGILGGGQLGRMLGFAARAMGYRVAALDPDEACPVAAVADRVEVGSYEDVAAALRMARGCDVVTYELEHVDATLVTALLGAGIPVRPGLLPLQVSHDRLAERRFVEAAGVAVAPWRALVTGDDAALRVAAAELALPLRLKAAFGGYDGRSQVRLATPAGIADAWVRLGAPAGTPALLERELAFESELSVVGARGLDGSMASYPAAGNRHVDGVLVESLLPAPVTADVAHRARAIAERLAVAMDLVGVLTVELFLMPDGTLVVNELAPRVHNSGHATLEACATSQFEQHIRAICNLPLGSAAILSPAAMLNLLGGGARRPAQLSGIAEALSDPAVHLHLYDKREVFAGRKMGHLTALAGSTEEALERTRRAHGRLRWLDGEELVASRLAAAQHDALASAR
jgi:5-(carboxyamino)imidazole ribonucleotide synthase